MLYSSRYILYVVKSISIARIKLPWQHKVLLSLASSYWPTVGHFWCYGEKCVTISVVITFFCQHCCYIWFWHFIFVFVGGRDWQFPIDPSFKMPRTYWFFIERFYGSMVLFLPGKFVLKERSRRDKKIIRAVIEGTIMHVSFYTAS